MHSCHNFPAGSWEAARVARICETSLLDPDQQISAKFQSKYKHIHTKNIISKISAILFRSQYVNILWPKQNGRHFADDTFKSIFFNQNVWIPIKISPKFVPKGRIHNIPALVQIMAWRRPGDKPLSEPMIDYRRIYASLGLNKLTREMPIQRMNQQYEATLSPSSSLWCCPADNNMAPEGNHPGVYKHLGRTWLIHQAHKSHIAPVLYPTMYHYVTEMCIIIISSIYFTRNYLNQCWPSANIL